MTAGLFVLLAERELSTKHMVDDSVLPLELVVNHLVKLTAVEVHMLTFDKFSSNHCHVLGQIIPGELPPDLVDVLREHEAVLCRLASCLSLERIMLQMVLVEPNVRVEQVTSNRGALSLTNTALERSVKVMSVVCQGTQGHLAEHLPHQHVVIGMLVWIEAFVGADWFE